MSIKLLLEKVLLIVLQEHDQRIYVQSRRIRLIRGTISRIKTGFGIINSINIPLSPFCSLVVYWQRSSILLADQVAHRTSSN